MLSVTGRDRQPEVMDQPGLDEDQHRLALAGLARINALSGTAGAVWTQILARLEPPPSPLRVLDLACGGGDVALGVARRARRCGYEVEVTGVDRSRVPVERAGRAAQRQGIAAHFVCGDVLGEPLPGGYHVVMSSLFLHHLEHAVAVALLRRMFAAASRLVVVDDLRRSRAGHLLALAGTRMLSRSAVVHVDGPRSVRAAFTAREARDLAREAGLTRIAVRRRWPARWLLTAVVA